MSSSNNLSFCLSSLALSLLLPCSVYAQQNQEVIEEVNVIGKLTEFGATKSRIPVVETSRSVSIETAANFLEKGALNLSQVATYSAGVSGEAFGYATRGDSIYSRGIAIPRYRDSIQELFGSFNTTRVETYVLEQVEILKGPASVLYGQGTPGGIVNGVSKTPKEDSFREIFTEVGNNDRVAGGLDFNGKLDDDGQWLGRFVAYGRESDTQVDFVNDDTFVFLPSVTYKPNESTEFTASYEFHKTDSLAAAQFVPVEGTLFPIEGVGFIDQDVFVGVPGFDRYDTESDQLSVLAKHQINAWLGIEATALYRSGEADYQQSWPTFTGAGNSRYLNQIIGAPVATPSTVARTFFQTTNTFDQAAVDVRFLFDFTTGDLTHEVLAGVQYQDVVTDDRRSFIPAAGVLQGSFDFVLDLANPVYNGLFPDQAAFDAALVDRPEQTVEDIGFYISDQISWNQWRFTLGLRSDEVDNEDGTRTQSDDAISTSVGALYRFENGLSPYINYSESFETVVGIDSDGNQLEPEEAEQYEVGVKYASNDGKSLVTLAAYDIKITNLPNPNATPVSAGQQQGEASIKGVELEGRGYWGDFYWQLAASLLNARDPNDFALQAVAEKQLSTWVTWKPTFGNLTGFKTGLGVRYFGESVAETLINQDTNPELLKYVTPSYTLADFMIGYEFPNWDVTLNVRNLEDKEYLTSCLTRGDCFPGVRRTAVAKVTYNF